MVRTKVTGPGRKTPMTAAQKAAKRKQYNATYRAKKKAAGMSLRCKYKMTTKFPTKKRSASTRRPNRVTQKAYETGRLRATVAGKY